MAGSAGATVNGRRILFLEVARGIAASLVVIHHLLVNVAPEYREFSHTVFDPGRVGVVTFFIVSGYVIPLSLAGQTQRTFWIRRFFRLFPVYWVAFGVYALFAQDSIAPAPWWVWGLNLLMLNGLIGLVSILPPAWTLSIELLFYAQSSFAKRIGRLNLAVHAGWVWLALYLALCVGAAVLQIDLPVTLPLLMFCAALGHALHLRDSEGSTVWRWLALAGVIIGPAGAFLRGSDGEWPPLTYSASFLIGVAVFLIFYVARARTLPRSLVWLGGVSYALYLFHITITHTFNKYMDLGPAVYVLTAGVASVLVAWSMHRWVELPSIEIGRKLTKKRTLRSPLR
ncbi:acyltransferase [Plantibacter flavus]|uniref:acyltransferase family protein n=1 Tax=Plantibacter flavus TaxID=150123 RepID=UPI0023780133|nr:acyltransferase [Plantibacter flavus]MDD9153899.1 acyltransferase [Plantibacter flavus]